MTFWLAAAFVRANGTIAAGYPLFDAGLIILGSIVAWRTNHDRTVVLKAVLSALPHLLGAVVIVRLPWWLHSKTALIQFCPGDASYCAPTNAGGPWQVYSEVQQRYWNVGFLSYYTLHKAPNFALAAPLVIWSLAATRNMLPRLSSLIFKPMEFLRAPLLPFTVHNAALTIVALLFMHVEVTTRLLCTSTPMLYWYAASGGPPRFQSCLTLGLLYATLGSFAHHAYLPWT